jgi:HD-GYP domain-containing protein (c-di-GMP phosphodiesterase class II)
MKRGTMNRRPANDSKLKRFLVLSLAALATALVLSGVAYAISPTAAIMGLVAIMWVATFRIAASNRKELALLREERESLRAGYDTVIERLCGAVGIRDEVADRETQRLSRLASILVRQMRVPTEQVKIVEQAAALRDVGKGGIAKSVLDKREDFNERDWSEMKKHPEIGYQILREIGFLREVAEVIRAHHERYDGQGYPHALRGESIPLAARILAVLDAYVAMTSQRPYRKTRSHSDAVQEILRCAGTQFDPEVVRAFSDLERRGLLATTVPEATRQIEPRVATEV